MKHLLRLAYFKLRKDNTLYPDSQIALKFYNYTNQYMHKDKAKTHKSSTY